MRSTRNYSLAARVRLFVWSGGVKVKVIEIELMLSRAEASALRAVLDEYVKAIQYLESNQPQNLPEHFGRERDAVIAALTAVENALQEAPEVIDGMGELSSRWETEIRLGQAPLSHEYQA